MPQERNERDERDLAGRRYAIVGAGLSGLAAAWYLQRRGAETHVIERDGEVGGRAGSGQLGERIMTLGGKNIGRGYTRFRAFTQSLGEYPYEHFGINSSRVIDGRVRTFDSGSRAHALRQLRGVPPRDLMRLGRLVLAVRRDPRLRYLDAACCARLGQRYHGESVEGAFGVRLRELLLRSLTVRVSAAEPDEVPMASVLPYLGMIVDSYDQLSGGMHEVLDAAARRSCVRLRTEARGLLIEDGHIRGLELFTADGESVAERFDGVLLATHAHAAARLLELLAPRVAALLMEVRYFPVTVLLAEYERPVFDTRVRAVVFGAEEPLSNAGAYGLNDLNIVRYTFSGRTSRGLAEREPDPESLAALAESKLAPYASLAENPRRALLARRISPGLCAYHPDQAAFLGDLSAAAPELPGLTLTGDYLRGCSIEACFAAAEEAVAGIDPSEHEIDGAPARDRARGSMPVGVGEQRGGGEGR
jgi:protoporphyrinogen/coproporphyrinogen III oxidase